MKYAEVIYEPGSKSVVSYEDLAELEAALTEQHRRAKSGELGGPAGGPAERVTRIISYDVHPADYNSDSVVHTNELTTLVEGMTGSDSCVSIEQLRSALADEASPTYPNDQGRHESMFKMNGEELSTEFLNDV